MSGVGRHAKQGTQADEAWRAGDAAYGIPPTPQYAAAPKRKRKRKGVKVLVGILITLVVLFGVAAGGAYFYIQSLNSAMSLGESLDDVKAALAEKEQAEEKGKNAFYVLIMGIDMREGAADPYGSEDEAFGSDGGVRSDTMMVARVDPDTSTVSLLTIPRDTPYEKYEDGRIRGVNYAYTVGGAPEVIKAVSDITGLKLSHYVEISGSGLVDLINGIGGVDVDVPMDFDYQNIAGGSVHLDAGMQHLDGDQALALANMRVLYDSGGDIIRQGCGREVVQAVMDSILSLPAVEIPGAISNAAACVKTDLSVSEIADYAQKMGRHATVYSGTGPTAGNWDPYVEYDPPKEGNQWLCYVDSAGWKKVIKAFSEGEDISKVSYKGDKLHYAGQPKDTWSRGAVGPEEIEGYSEDEYSE